MKLPVEQWRKFYKRFTTSELDEAVADKQKREKRLEVIDARLKEMKKKRESVIESYEKRLRYYNTVLRKEEENLEIVEKRVDDLKKGDSKKKIKIANSLLGLERSRGS